MLCQHKLSKLGCPDSKPKASEQDAISLGGKKTILQKQRKRNAQFFYSFESERRTIV